MRIPVQLKITGHNHGRSQKISQGGSPKKVSHNEKKPLPHIVKKAPIKRKRAPYGDSFIWGANTYTCPPPPCYAVRCLRGYVIIVNMCANNVIYSTSRIGAHYVMCCAISNSVLRNVRKLRITMQLSSRKRRGFYSSFQGMFTKCTDERFEIRPKLVVIRRIKGRVGCNYNNKLRKYGALGPITSIIIHPLPEPPNISSPPLPPKSNDQPRSSGIVTASPNASMVSTK